MDLLDCLELPVERYIDSKTWVELMYGRYTWQLLWDNVLSNMQQLNAIHYNNYKGV